jgi:hypothetical protein
MKPILAQKVSDLLVAAIGRNGGSWYWCYEANLLRSAASPTKFPWYACSKVFERAFAFEFVFDEKYEGMGDGRKVVTDVDVRRALKIMRRAYPKRYADVMGDRGDGDTADVFVQVLVHGKAIYGEEAPRKHYPYSPAMRAWIEERIAEGKKIVAETQARG